MKEQVLIQQQLNPVFSIDQIHMLCESAMQLSDYFTYLSVNLFYSIMQDNLSAYSGRNSSLAFAVYMVS